MPENTQQVIQNQNIQNIQQQEYSLKTPEAEEAFKGPLVFSEGNYHLDITDVGKSPVRDFLDIDPIEEDELERIKKSYIRYLISSGTNHYRLRISSSFFPNWHLNWGMLHWQPDLVRFLLPTFFCTNIYDQVRVLLGLKIIAEKGLKKRTPKEWEKLRREINDENPSAVPYIPSPILGEYLLLEEGGKLDVFPFVPLILPKFSSFDIDAANKFDFALDLSSYLSPTTQLLGRYMGVLGMTLAAGGGVLNWIVRALQDPAALVEGIVKGVFYIAGAIVDLFQPKGYGLFDATIQTLKRPETLFMIKGPLLWRGSEAADWTCSGSFVVPAILYVDLDNIKDIRNDDQILNNLHIITEEDCGGKSQLLSLWTETISRWLILPVRRYKQLQMFGWMAGFSCVVKDATGRELYYWGVPDTWANINITPGVDGVSFPQEFEFSVSGKSMVFGDLPDLMGLYATLRGMIFKMERMQ